MLLTLFTLFHVVLSLVGIGAGFVVLNALLKGKWVEPWTNIFLWTTIATSVTGFMFPVTQFLPAHALGIVSLIALGIALLARRRLLAAGVWRRTYVIAAAVALYLNVLVLIVQLFQKVPALHALAPTQSEPPFQIVQLATLLTFAVLTFRAVTRFHAAPAPVRLDRARSAKA